MKSILLEILDNYLSFFKDEQNRQSTLVHFLKNHNNKEIIDWNNFDGHVVASGFVYAVKEEKFLVLYHNDLHIFLYPGGHIEKMDIDPLHAAKREIEEETGLKNLKQLGIFSDKLIPIDIDTHRIKYNKRLNLPEHYHFDFRYLFAVDKISDIKIDYEELSNYKWISIEELKADINYGPIVKKINKILANNK